MLTPCSACPPWSADRSSTRIEDRRSYTTPGGTIRRADQGAKRFVISKAWDAIQAAHGPDAETYAGIAKALDRYRASL